jgi:hypothetical protein
VERERLEHAPERRPRTVEVAGARDEPGERLPDRLQLTQDIFFGVAEPFGLTELLLTAP